MEEILAGLAARTAAAPGPAMLVLVFLGGVLSSASPCVLAAVPLVVAMVGGAGTSRARAATLTVAFAAGLAVCFTALGAVAALSGRLLGDVGLGAAWPLILAAVLAAMGLHLAGVLHLPTPRLDAARFGRAGIAGAVALGALTGTLSSPCATPILVVILSLVAFEQKVLWGTTLLLAYSAGHVVLLLAAGLATGFVAAFVGSRAAVWAGRVQRAFGWALVVLGVGVCATALRRVLAA
jgi:cytochrome c biogenesis protein CcdA